MKDGDKQQRELKPTDRHKYFVPVESGQFLQVTLEEIGIDASLAILNSDGREEFRMDKPGRAHLSETVSVLTRQAESIFLEVAPSSQESIAGSYQIRISLRRPAKPGDQERIAAERALGEGHLRNKQGGTANWNDAIRHYQDAQAVYRRLDERSNLAEAEYWIGMTLLQLEEFESSLDSLHRSSAGQREVGNKLGEAAALYQAGRCQRKLGHTEEALSAYRKALGLYMEEGQPSQQAIVLSNLGALLQSTGKFSEARKYHQQALEIFRTAGETDSQARILTSLGFLEDELGDPIQALAHYDEALSLARPKDATLRMSLLNNLGLLHSRMGEKQAALELYSQSIQIAKQSGSRRLQAIGLLNLGSIHLHFANPEHARNLFAEALSLSQQLADLRLEAVAQNSLGRAYDALDQPVDAEASYQAALKIQQERNDSNGQAAIWTNLGVLDLDCDRPEQASQRLERALGLYREMQDRRGESKVRFQLARAYSAEGNRTAALEQLQIAQQLILQSDAPADEVEVLREMARIRMAQGRLEEAEPLLKRAVGLVEDLRVQIAGDYLRSSYFSSLRQTNMLYVDLLMRLHTKSPQAGYAARAFEASEAARARSLIDSLRAAGVTSGRDAAPELLKERQDLLRRINYLDERRLKWRGEKAETAAKRLRDLLADYRFLDSRIRSRSQAEWSVGVNSATLKQVQGQLDEETVLLEYALGHERSYLWSVTSKASQSYKLPAEAKIEEVVRQAHKLLQIGDTNAYHELEKLSQMVLPPALVQQIAAKRLAIVPDGPLHYIPFSVLPLPESKPHGSGPDGHRPLLVDYEVVHLPSASALIELRQRRRRVASSSGSVAVIADPVFRAIDSRLGNVVAAMAESFSDAPDLLSSRFRDGWERLRWSRKEAESIAAAAGDREVFIALNFDANLETALGQQVAESRIVHFATHGLVDSHNPELSALVLSQFDQSGKPHPGYLRLAEIYSMRLQADLVFLSACQTALGKEIRGEGLLGLTRGFLAAGAHQVIASLWRVPDRDTAELTRRFYNELFQGSSPSASLRQAQLSFWKESGWRYMLHWGAFLPLGDWRR